LYAANSRDLENTDLSKTGYLSILLSALVVLCPFKCIIGGLTLPVGDESAACAGCCDHCSRHGDDRSPSNPTVPTDCNCGDCFCHGALPVNTVSDDVAVAELVSFMTVWTKLETMLVVAKPAACRRNSNPLPVDASALEVRASLCCWVI
jgi:hypothetical protein